MYHLTFVVLILLSAYVVERQLKLQLQQLQLPPKQGGRLTGWLVKMQPQLDELQHWIWPLAWIVAGLVLLWAAL